ncbi:MAG: hypothetical protein IPL77_10125 [Flavobacteriales bacterium]|nr:hypothetical protein [Flavobacteriales bacterium]
MDPPTNQRIVHLNMRPSSIILLALVPLILCAGCSPSGPTTAEPEVLLVGVVHQLPDSLSCNWKSAYDKVLRYAPDAMAVEHVPTVDTLSLAHFFGEDFKDYRDSVIVSWEGRRLSLEEMNTLRNTPPAGADSTARLMHQWRYAALMLDMANRDQASFQLRNVDVSRLADTSTAFGRAFVKRHERILGYMRTTEFGNLVHPLAAVLGIEHLYPTDERRYNAEQSLAYQAFAEKLDSAGLAAYGQLWAKFNAAEAEAMQQCTVLDRVNTHAWIARGDSLQTKALAAWGDADFAAFVRAWEARNSSIADRIIAAAEADQAQRIAAFYGYIHVAPVKRALEAKGYRVKVLDDLK